MEKKSFSHRLRRLLIDVHRWTALIFGLWFVLVGVTGFLMAWRAEISGMELRWRYPVAKPSATASMISVTQAVTAVREAYPFFSERELASVTVPSGNMPCYAFVSGRGQRRLTFLVDPYTACVHRPVNLRNLFMGTVNQLHTRLLSGFRGYVANGALSMFGLLSLVTGLYLWWPPAAKQWKDRLTVRRGVSMNRTLYDLHNVSGAYLYPVLLLVTVTAPLMVGEHLIRDGVEGFRSSWATNGQQEGRGERQGNRGSTEGRVAGRAGRPDQVSRGEGSEGRTRGRGAGEAMRAEGPALPKVAPQGTRLSDDELLAMGRQLVRSGEITRLRRPVEADEPFLISYQLPYGLERNESLYLDPYRGQAIPAPAPTPGRRSPFMAVVHQLHHGEYGGVFSKLLYSITGLMPLALFVTGVTLWSRKKITRAQKARGLTATPPPLRQPELATVTAAAESSSLS